MRKVWLSTTYYLDEKIDSLSPSAEVMFIRGIALAGNIESDGRLTPNQVRTLARSKPERGQKELIEAGLWRQNDDKSVQIVSWDEWQISAADVRKRRTKDNERQARHRTLSRRDTEVQIQGEEIQEDTTPPKGGVTAPADEPPQTPDGRPHLSVVADPDDTETEPDPEPEPAPAKTRRGTRLPENFMPRPETIERIRGTFPAITSRDLDLAHANFCDYWLAATGRGATKIEWDRAWSKWMREEFDKPRYRGAAAKSGPTAREVKRARAEALKDNPNPAELAKGGLAPAGPAVEGQQSIASIMKELTA